MNGVMIIPTGIGCEIGGHAGDANPACKLLASCCDKLIIHPNVVNASDINEMPDNCWYVEGSILDRFLEGKIELKGAGLNKILLVVNPPVQNHTINAVSAARATIGADVQILELDEPLTMVATMEGGVATGLVNGFASLVDQVSEYEFDALAIATLITVSNETMMDYFKTGGVNPIGGVEAKASKLIAERLNKPVAHAPFEEWQSELWKYNEVVDPRLSAEMVSTCYLHCVLKGLHRAPRIGKGFSVNDIDFMVSPDGCWSRPHIACEAAGIPIIEVLENKTVFSKGIAYNTIWAKNYWEAAGIIQCWNAGISLGSVRRPLESTVVLQ